MEKDYKVKLEVFEGPLDLLLFLIKRDEIDIYDIPIEHITSQYLEYLEAFQELDLDIAGEFVLMAANLIYIKSRSLLPVQDRGEEEEEEEADPRWELVRQLLEYKKFKEASMRLGEMEANQSALFRHIPEVPNTEPERPIGEVSIFDLINAFQKILKRTVKKEHIREIFEENFTVSDKIEWVLKLTASGKRLTLSSILEGTVSRTEVVVTFLAILELIRLKQLAIRQDEPFAEIEIRRREDAPESPHFISTTPKPFKEAAEEE
ncbi:MAG: segregation and condensation protein A [Chthoniobacteraceae bacterium]